MKVYTVHEPGRDAATGGGGPGALSDRIDRAESLRFVGDGFTWSAALFTPIVLLANRLYGAFAVYVAAIAAAVAVMMALGADGEWIALAIGAIQVAFGFEYGELLRGRLDTDGWIEQGIVTGRSRAECERRFLDGWLASQPMISGLRDAQAQAPQAGSLPGAARPAGWRGGLSWRS